MDDESKKHLFTTTTNAESSALWYTNISRAAKAAFGVKWQNCEEAHTFEGELSEVWLKMAAAAEARDEATLEIKGWIHMTIWLQEQIA